MKRIDRREFFEQDAVSLAHALLGKIICYKKDMIDPDNGKKYSFEMRERIMTTEAYCKDESVTDGNRNGEKDSQYLSGGHLHYSTGYIRMDIVANKEGVPEGVLIRDVGAYHGPSNSVWALDMEAKLDGLDLVSSKDVWIEDDGVEVVEKAPRERKSSENWPEKEKATLLQFSVKGLIFPGE